MSEPRAWPPWADDFLSLPPAQQETVIGFLESFAGVLRQPTLAAAAKLLRGAACVPPWRWQRISEAYESTRPTEPAPAPCMLCGDDTEGCSAELRYRRSVCLRCQEVPSGEVPEGPDTIPGGVGG